MTILLCGKLLSEVEPDWTEEALADVYASTEWRADVQARPDRLNALSDEDYERLVNADQVSMLVHPWSGYDPDAFDGLVRMWLPRPVPAPGDWDAKVIAAEYTEWPMLYVLFPGERPCIDTRDYIQPATPPDAEQTLDAYASNSAQIARYKLAGCQVSDTPDGGEPLLLTTAARARGSPACAGIGPTSAGFRTGISVFSRTPTPRCERGPRGGGRRRARTAHSGDGAGGCDRRGGAGVGGRCGGDREGAGGAALRGAVGPAQRGISGALEDRHTDERNAPHRAEQAPGNQSQGGAGDRGDGETPHEREQRLESLSDERSRGIHRRRRHHAGLGRGRGRLDSTPPRQAPQIHRRPPAARPACLRLPRA